MESKVNKRQTTRYFRHDRLLVQILAASESMDIADRTFVCKSVDASLNGMKIELDREIAVGSLVDLWASFEGMEQKFYLRGRVCWCYELGSESAQFQLGVELEEAFATDYERWRSLISSFSEEYSQPL